MRQNLEFRAIVGILIWIGLVAVGIIFARQSFSRAPEATKLIAQYVGNQRRTIEIELDDYQLVATGDPVYLADSDDVAPIGIVTRVKEANSTFEGLAWVKKAYITLYGVAPLIADGDYVTYHTAPDSSAWVLKTMLHDEKRRELTKLIVDSYRKNQDDILAALRPVVENSLREASEVVREDLEGAFHAREDEIRRIGQRFQKDLIEEEIMPLIQEEIWPIVQAESEPLVNRVGQKIWSEVSVFGFGWRYLYDSVPLTDKRLTEREFRRFVDEKAIPILQAHLPEFVELQKSVIKKISQNEQVKSTVAKSVNTVVSDPEVQGVIREVFNEVFLNNDRLKVVLEEHWQGPEARRAIALANERLEPTITEIGTALFGSPTEKITPEFARVIRHRILHKDTRWFTLHAVAKDGDTGRPAAPSPSTLPARVAETPAEIPYAPARVRN